jgi:CBS domain-containing protein
VPKIKDIMTECVVSVNKETPMYEVAQLLATNNITGIPVVEDDMTVVGIITEKDVLDLFHVLQYSENRTVNSSMTQSVITFDVEDNLEDVSQCLKDGYFRRVPVTSKGKLIGIISRRDLILYIIRCRQGNT